MIWQTITSAFGNSVYSLLNNGKQLLTLDFHPSSNAARVSFEMGERRVFLLRKEGLFKNKVVLRDEYGNTIGRIGNENNRTFVSVGDARYYVNAENINNAETAVNIYNTTEQTPIASYNIDKTTITAPVRESLLMVLCWCLYAPEKISAAL